MHHALNRNTRIFVIATFLLLLSCMAAPVRAEGSLELVGHFGGDTKGLAVIGHYAYVGCGARLVVIDITNPADPVKAGQSDVLTYAIRDVAASGDVVYVSAGGDSIYLFNVSDPVHPTPAGSLSIGNWVDTLRTNGPYMYAFPRKGYDPYSNLRVIDVSSPASPVLRGSYAMTEGIYDIAFCGNYAYMVQYGQSLGDGVGILDISDPAHPVRVAYYTESGTDYTGIDISGKYAYTRGWSTGLDILDLTDPVAPVRVSSLSWGSGDGDLWVRGDYVYATISGAGVETYNVADPLHPFSMHWEDTVQSVGSSVLYGAYLIMASRGLHVYDVDDPADIRYLKRLDISVSGARLDLAGGYVYTAGEGWGMNVLDVSDPSNPVHIGHTTGYDVLDVAVRGGYAYTVGWDGLQVWDISNPAAPLLAVDLGDVGHATAVELAGNYAYVADDDYIYIVNIDHPTAPTVSASYRDWGSKDDLAAEGTRLYVQAGAGFDILDVSNPTSPVDITRYYWGPGFDVRGTYAYSSSQSYRRLSISDLADPRVSVYVGGCSLYGDAVDLKVIGNRVLASELTNGFQIVDVSNPSTPACTGGIDTAGSVYASAGTGRYVYVLDNLAGLYVYRTSDVWIQSVSPAFGLNTGLSWTVTIAGANFVPGSTVKLAATGMPDIPAIDPTVTSEQITCRFDLTGAPVGVRNLVIAAPGGATSSLADGFMVKDSMPVITAVSPSERPNTGPVDVEITGSGFPSFASVYLRKPGQADTPATGEVVVNSSKITCTFDVTGKAGGSWDVVVMSGTSEVAILPEGFTVLIPPPPSPSTIAPTLVHNAGLVNLTITGDDFIPGAAVKLTMPGQSDVVATGVAVTGSTQVNCTLDLNRKRTGMWNVVVTNPGGQSGMVEQGLRVTSAVRHAKLLPNGGSIDLYEVTITAVSGGGYFYVEDDERTAGLLVYGPASAVAPGDRIGLRGYMATALSGERCLQGNKSADFGTGSIEPILMSVRSVAGGNWFYDPVTGEGQKGVTGGLGLNNVGLLVSVAGKVTFAGSNYFWVDDGSGVKVGAYKGVKVQANSLTIPPLDSYVKVTGISSIYVQGSLINRVILTRSQADIVPIQAQ